MLSALLSSFMPVYADAPTEDSKDQKDEGGKNSEEGSKNEGEQDHQEGKQDGEQAEAEEEEEPEDEHPTLRDECSNSPACVGFKKHFDHCQEKVEAGEGHKGEDCVEEIMMHCADHCVAPKLFSKLR